MVDNRQFIITNKDINYKDFKKIKINNYWLLYQDNLRIEIQEDKDGVCWYILGQAYCADTINKTPADDIKDSHTHEITSKYFYWAGRWTLIGNNQIHIDCVGLYSHYYYQKNDEWYISPSMGIVVNCNIEDFPDIENSLIQNISFDWYPAPLTKVDGIYRMFTSQIIQISEKGLKTIPREILSFKYNSYTEEEKIILLCKYLSNILVNIYKYSNKKIWLALTGGGDSRTLLSILMHEKIPFETYVMDYNLILKGDKTIPKKLSEDFGFRHYFITAKGNLSREMINEFDEHTFGNLNDGNRLFYGYSQYDLIPKDVLLLKAAIFEIGKGFYFDVLKDPLNVRGDIYKAFPDLVNYKKYKHSLDLWFNWVEEHPYDMDMRDRLYLEQRNGGWIANLEQGLEIMDQESIHPANCAVVVSLLASLSDETKQNGYVNKYIIEHLCPELLKEPINPKDKMRMIKYYAIKIYEHPIVSFKKGIRKIIKIFNVKL